MLFDGEACFSPEVPPSIQETWVANGGKLRKSPKDNISKMYVFCSAMSDSWVSSLVRKAVPVFSANWIVNAAIANFRIPIAPYVLNGCTDINVTEPLLPKTPLRQIHRSPEEPPKLLPIKRPYQPQDVPESPEPPRKKARTMKQEMNDLKDMHILAMSRVKFVRDVPPISANPQLPQERKIPHIDLSEIQGNKRKSSLTVHFVRKSKSLPDLPRRTILVSESAGKPVPRMSLRATLKTLQHIKIDNCALVTPGAFHDGLEFQCDFASPDT